VSRRDLSAGKTGSGLLYGIRSGRLQHQPPLGQGKAIRSLAGQAISCRLGGRLLQMLLVASAAQGQAALDAGALACPGCAAVLRPWGWTKPRRARARDGRIGLTRLRRARCGGCGVSHVLLPAAWLPRRLDEVDVIGAALLGAGCGAGHRRLADRLDRPDGTVRGWLRAARQRAGWVHAQLATVGARLPDHHLGAAVPPPTPLGEVVETAGRVASAYRRHLGTGLLPAWQLLNQLTDGRLLAPAATAPG
jgi:hypothetical protein